jgi:glycosyl transferase family 87
MSLDSEAPKIFGQGYPYAKSVHDRVVDRSGALVCRGPWCRFSSVSRTLGGTLVGPLISFGPAISVLTRKRLRAYATIMAATMWTVWLVDMSVSGPTDRLGKVKGTDFLQFYVIGSIAHEGRWEQLFDVQPYIAREQAVVPGSADTLYIPIQSPQMALVFAPFAAHRYTVALALWLTVVFAMYACSCFLMWRDCTALHAHRDIVVASCVAFPGLYSEVLHGQTACFSLAAVAIALFALRREWRLTAGLALGSLVFKPHWVLAAGAVFFFAREWRVVAGAAVAALAQVAVTYVLLGASVMTAYWRMLRAVPRIADLLEPQPGDSLRGLFRVLMPFEPAAFFLYGAAAFVTLLITARVWRSNAAVEIRLSAIVLALILISPHVNAYDLILLAPIFFLLANWLVRSPGDSRGRVLSTWLCILIVAPIVGGLPAILRLQFSVTAMAAILFLLWRIVRRDVRVDSLGYRTSRSSAG